MEEDSEFRRWDELIPDALELIFRNLSLQETLTVIPRVCKSWWKAVTGPYCWQDIDIEQWSQQCRPDTLDRMLHMLITRSSGSLRKLCVTGLPNNRCFSFMTKLRSTPVDSRFYVLSLPLILIQHEMPKKWGVRVGCSSGVDLTNLVGNYIKDSGELGEFVCLRRGEASG